MSKPGLWLFCLLLPLLLLLTSAGARAQDNFEIQVYASELVPEGKTMFELHSNFTVRGSTQTSNGLLPTQGALHETLEITHGWTEFLETGFYQFTSLQVDGTYQWVGTHIRPRFAVPQSWEWPIGVSLSTEFGYQRPQFSQDTWTLEVRPIFDVQLDRWYLAFNPTLDLSLAGQNKKRGFIFSPNVKVAYTCSPTVQLGLEYYGSLGPVGSFDIFTAQQHQLVPSIDLNLDEDLEFNFGVAFGLTNATDKLIPKLILGRRFDL